MGGLTRYLKSSTLKREFACVVMLWYIATGSWLMFRMPVTAVTPDAALQTWGSLQVAVFALAASAFAADWISKETTIAGPPANTQITTEATVTDDTTTVTTSTEPTKP